MGAAFAYTVDGQTVMGNKVVQWGTFTSTGGATGGSIIANLDRIEAFFLQQNAAAVVADAPVVNATFPLASGTVPIVTTANAAGYWMAMGNPL